jgi:hypothetical protein
MEVFWIGDDGVNIFQSYNMSLLSKSNPNLLHLWLVFSARCIG